MKKIFIANWKMSPQSFNAAEKLAKGVLRGLKVMKRRPEIVLCPPFLWLTDFSHKIKQVKWGAQDVFWKWEGAYTGEVSPKMLKNSGVGFVIVGHSERRETLGESDEIINKKTKAALEAGLKVVLCVGERDRDNVNFQNFVRDELKADLRFVSKRAARNLIIAYEPIWAIGTGRSAKPEDVFEMTTFIRRTLLDILGKKAAYETPILYGGSVNPKNARRFLNVKGMNGLLVGKASVSAREFISIVLAGDV